jgi:hypothetical protein
MCHQVRRIEPTEAQCLDTSTTCKQFAFTNRHSTLGLVLRLAQENTNLPVSTCPSVEEQNGNQELADKLTVKGKYFSFFAKLGKDGACF